MRASRYTRASFWNFGTLALPGYSGDKKIKSGLLSNHLFQRKQENGGWKEPTDNN